MAEARGQGEQEPVQCAPLLCTALVHCCSALLLCTASVHRSCALLLCTAPVHCSCAPRLCTSTVHCSCALLLCTTSVHRSCALFLCTAPGFLLLVSCSPWFWHRHHQRSGSRSRYIATLALEIPIGHPTSILPARQKQVMKCHRGSPAQGRPGKTWEDMGRHGNDREGQGRSGKAREGQVMPEKGQKRQGKAREGQQMPP